MESSVSDAPLLQGRRCSPFILVTPTPTKGIKYAVHWNAVTLASVDGLY